MGLSTKVQHILVMRMHRCCQRSKVEVQMIIVFRWGTLLPQERKGWFSRRCLWWCILLWWITGGNCALCWFFFWEDSSAGPVNDSDESVLICLADTLRRSSVFSWPIWVHFFSEELTTQEEGHKLTRHFCVGQREETARLLSRVDGMIW